jgi:hypothetical protein
MPLLPTIQKLLALPHSANPGKGNNASKAKKSHEDVVKNAITALGYREMSLRTDFLGTEYPECNKTQLQTKATHFKRATIGKDNGVIGAMECFTNKKCFIPQPFGSQEAPDFLLVDGNAMLFVELKSTTTNTIHLNSGVPRTNVLFICTSPKHGAICLLGQHLFSEDMKRAWRRASREFKQLSGKLNDKLRSCHNIFETTFYLRPMWVLGKSLFTHPQITEYQQEAINYIKWLDAESE